MLYEALGVIPETLFCPSCVLICMIRDATPSDGTVDFSAQSCMTSESPGAIKASWKLQKSGMVPPRMSANVEGATPAVLTMMGCAKSYPKYGLATLRS